MERINLDQFATETLANRELYRFLAINVHALTDEKLLSYDWTKPNTTAVRIVTNELKRRGLPINGPAPEVLS